MEQTNARYVSLSQNRLGVIDIIHSLKILLRLFIG
jgi:hypothetical protein